MRRRNGRVVWLACAVLTLGCVGPDTVPSVAPVSTQPTATQADAHDGLVPGPVYDEIVRHIERLYYREIRLDTSRAPDVRALMAQLDSHSAYIPPDELDWLDKMVAGRFGGIGVQIGIRNSRLTVLSPLLDTPAWHAGVRPGDVITQIEGRPTAQMTLHEVLGRLTGPPGTEVAFLVSRAGRGQPIPFRVRRDRIEVQSVMGDRRKADLTWDYMIDHERRIGYVRITTFTRRTATELKRCLAELKAERARGLILDLRFNPGGMLEAGIDVADLFLDAGLIVAVQKRVGTPRRYPAGAQRAIGPLPIVVLVNDYSASSSEIVAAALQDHGCATLVGQRTYGKGSVQTFVPLRRGAGGLKITSALYYRPNGGSFHRTPEAKVWGLVPDVSVDMDREQQRLLLEDRQRRDRVDPDQTTPPVCGHKDPQLARALAIVHAALDRSTSWRRTRRRRDLRRVASGAW